MYVIFVTGRPSPPVNLQVLVNSTADGSVTTVRVEWDPPLDTGTPITSYQVTVNEKTISTIQLQQTITINTTTSSGLPMYLVEVQAVNCAGQGNASRLFIDTRGETGFAWLVCPLSVLTCNSSRVSHYSWIFRNYIPVQNCLPLTQMSLPAVSALI